MLVLDADAKEMGYLGAAALVPNLLFALHAGALVDRRGRRRQTMIAADLGRFVLVGTIPLAYALDVLTMGQLYAVAFLAGTLSVLFGVSYNTLFVSLVERDRYIEANSLVHGSRAVGRGTGHTITRRCRGPHVVARSRVIVPMIFIDLALTGGLPSPRGRRRNRGTPNPPRTLLAGTRLGPRS